MATNAIKSNTIRWENNRGANERDDPSTLPLESTRQSINVMLENVGLGTRRRGIGLGMLFANSTGAGNPLDPRSIGFARLFISNGVFTGTTVGLDRSTPPLGLLSVNPVGGVGFTFTVPDAVTSDARFTDWLEYNGKLYFTYQSTQNRLHEMCVFTSIRSGLPAPAAPTTANTGAGAYAATLRYYRIQYYDDGANGAVVTRRIVLSNLGTATSFTPSGAGTGVNVTRPALPAGENISHWIVFGSADGANYYNLSGNIVAATTVFFDNATPATYFSGRTAAPLEGTYTPWPSVKYLAKGNQRLLGFGVWDQNGTSQGLSVISGRVYFSPTANTTDTHDDERISNTLTTKGWIDVGERNQGRIDRGILDPIDDMNLVFQDVGVWGLVPTGNDQAPFRRIRLDPRRGSCGQKSHFIGEDESGNPCAYFLDPVRGPYRYGARGFEWLGYDISQYCGGGALINQADYVHGVWDPIYLCCRWWVNIDSNDEPQTQVVFFPRLSHVVRRGEVRGGWVVHDGLAGQFVCSCIGVSDNWGSEDNSNILVGGLARGVSPTTIACIDNSLNNVDNPSIDALDGTVFAGVIESKAFAAPVPQIVTQIGQAYLQAKASSGAQITQGILRNFGLGGVVTPQGVSTVDLASTAAEAHVLRKFASIEGLVDQFAFAVRLEDVTMVSTLHEYGTAGTFQLIADEGGQMIVDVIGGGGGPVSSSQPYSEGGSGGGGYARFGPTLVAVGDVIDIVVGAGGGSGANGGVSSITVNGSLLARATGGGTPVVGFLGGAAGQGTNGTVLYNGGAGGDGVNLGARGGGGGGGAAGPFNPGLSGGAGGVGAGAGGAANGGYPGTPAGAGGAGGASGVVGSSGIAAGGGAGGSGSGAVISPATGAAGYARVRIFPATWTIDRWLSSFENGSEV